MFNVQVGLQDDGHFAQVEAVIGNPSAWLDPIVRESVESDVIPVILPQAQAEPGPVKKPIRWTSLRQMRYVKLMQRKGLIAVPYVRTHLLSQSWAFTVDTMPGMTVIMLGNSASHFPYVEGYDQQGFHADTGWFYAPDVALDWGGQTIQLIALSIGEAWADLKAS